MHKIGSVLDQRKFDHGSHKRTRTQRCIVVYLKLGYVHTDVDIVLMKVTVCPEAIEAIVFALWMFSPLSEGNACCLSEGENVFEGVRGR